MSRWFVTGDKHGDIQPIINFIKRFDLGIDDNIIVVGDMGLFWRQDMKDAEYNIAEYEKNCNGVNLYWIDGNHENFDIINSWDLTKTEIDNSPHIHYLTRGTEMIVDINGNTKRLLFVGGADSVDKMFRTKHLSWWPEEQIKPEDIDIVLPHHYDYVFTHCCPLSVFKSNMIYLCTLNGIDQSKVDHTSEVMLDVLKDKITYNHHFFGHYHIDKQLDDKHTCIFNDFIELEGD